jgi:hypothetical protein
MHSSALLAPPEDGPTDLRSDPSGKAHWMAGRFSYAVIRFGGDVQLSSLLPQQWPSLADWEA